MPCANNKGADQPAPMRSLFSAFIVRCLDSIIPLVSLSEISSLYLAPVAEQAGLSLPRRKLPKTAFLVMWLTWFMLSLNPDQNSKTLTDIIERNMTKATK